MFYIQYFFAKKRDKELKKVSLSLKKLKDFPINFWNRNLTSKSGLFLN